MAQWKVNISFPPSVVERMDEYCRQHCLTRSGFVTMAVDSYLTARSMTDALKELTQTVKHLAETQGTTEELEKIDKVCELLELASGKEL